LGGGHEIAWGSFLGLRHGLDARHDHAPVLVLNLDAHLDLRTSRPASSGSPFDQIGAYCAAHGLPWQYACLGVAQANNTAALFARAQELGAFWVEDLGMRESDLGARLADVDRLLANAAHVYLSIDLDVLPAADVPGVSAPAAYGVPSDIAGAEADIALAIVRAPGSTATAQEIGLQAQAALPRFARPRYLRLLDALPKTPTAKVQRAALRKQGVADAIDLESITP